MMKHTFSRLLSSAVLVASFGLSQAAFSASSSPTATWFPVGPDGGDARSFAYNPSNTQQLYMGTANSWLYRSDDSGATWKRVVKLAKTSDFVIDNIVVDSSDNKTVFAGTWSVDHPDGGIFVSHDAGNTWNPVADMREQSVRALAQSPSNPKIYVAGTLKGVYRSEDGGVHWTLISPAGSAELHEVESVAIDPVHPETIYAGTWHLPWKTTDGGAHWKNIKQGLIDDSDVFSIIIDQQQPKTVYLSACSGIYKSEDAAEVFHKIQGIPSTARRTRVLMQDPVSHNVVYAGTTEGLYKTTDAGKTFQRMTGPDVIINDVYVDPKNPQRVLLATDRGGVLTSMDASVSFKQSNTGFSQRQVTALLVDAKNPQTVYAGVVNDKTYGGVFVSPDNGVTWQQRSTGLDGRDVFALAQAADGSILAGTTHGIFRWDGSTWVMSGQVTVTEEKTVTKVKNKKQVKSTVTVVKPAGAIDVRVNSIDASGSNWYAATTAGIYMSSTQGASWQRGSSLAQSSFATVTAGGHNVFAVRRSALVVSQDDGATWKVVPLPSPITLVTGAAATPSGTLWLGGHEGLLLTSDGGETWNALKSMPFAEILGLSYDPLMGRVIVTSRGTTWGLAIKESDKSWTWWDSGWNLRDVHFAAGRLLGVSGFDGVVAQPLDHEATAAVASHQ